MKFILALILVLNSSLCFSDIKIGPLGGTGGSEFNDTLGYYEKICGIYARHSKSKLYGLQIEACDYWGNRTTKKFHGSQQGTADHLQIAEDDQIETIQLTTISINGSSRVTGINIYTKKGKHKTFGYYGVSLQDERVYSSGTFYKEILPPEGYEIHGLFGRSGKEIDSLGVYMRKTPGIYSQQGSGRFGSAGGGEKSRPFTDLIDRGPTPEERLCGFNIWHGNRIDAIQTKICNKNHQTAYKYLNKHGGSGGKQDSFNFSNGTRLQKIRGWVGNKNGTTRIFGLQFLLSDGSYSKIFGDMTGFPFELTVPEGFYIDNLFGASVTELDSIGLSLQKIE